MPRFLFASLFWLLALGSHAFLLEELSLDPTLHSTEETCVVEVVLPTHVEILSVSVNMFLSSLTMDVLVEDPQTNEVVELSAYVEVPYPDCAVVNDIVEVDSNILEFHMEPLSWTNLMPLAYDDFLNPRDEVPPPPPRQPPHARPREPMDPSGHHPRDAQRRHEFIQQSEAECLSLPTESERVQCLEVIIAEAEQAANEAEAVVSCVVGFLAAAIWLCGCFYLGRVFGRCLRARLAQSEEQTVLEAVAIVPTHSLPITDEKTLARMKNAAIATPVVVAKPAPVPISTAASVSSTSTSPPPEIAVSPVAAVAPSLRPFDYPAPPVAAMTK